MALFWDVYFLCWTIHPPDPPTPSTPPPSPTEFRLLPAHACTHKQVLADLGVWPLHAQGHELSYSVFPQAVELRLLPAELDQQQGQLLGLHRASHTEENSQTPQWFIFDHPQKCRNVVSSRMLWFGLFRHFTDSNQTSVQTWSETCSRSENK